MHAVIDTRIGGVRQNQDCGHTSGQQNAIIISITTAATVLFERKIFMREPVHEFFKLNYLSESKRESQKNRKYFFERINTVKNWP